MSSPTHIFSVPTALPSMCKCVPASVPNTDVFSAFLKTKTRQALIKQIDVVGEEKTSSYPCSLRGVCTEACSWSGSAALWMMNSWTLTFSHILAGNAALSVTFM